MREQKKREHEAKLERQRKQNEEMRREDEANRQKKEEEANERRKRRQPKEEEETRIQTARKVEDERWEEGWAKLLEEASDRLKQAENKLWRMGGRIVSIYTRQAERELAERENLEAKLDADERRLELSWLKKEKQDEKEKRDRDRAKEDAERKKR
jgi:uncharacterized protein with GYD domain